MFVVCHLIVSSLCRYIGLSRSSSSEVTIFTLTVSSFSQRRIWNLINRFQNCTGSSENRTCHCLLNFDLYPFAVFLITGVCNGQISLARETKVKHPNNYLSVTIVDISTPCPTSLVLLAGLVIGSYFLFFLSLAIHSFSLHHI